MNAFVDIIEGLSSVEAQRLIERFNLMQPIADGSLAGATLLTNPKRRIPAPVISKSLSAEQFGKLIRLMGEGNFLSSTGKAGGILANTDWVTAIADGSVDNALIVRDHVSVTYKTLGGIHRTATLLLVGYGMGIDNAELAIAMLKEYGLKPATADHGHAYLGSCGDETHINSVRAVALPGTTYTSHGQVTYAVIRRAINDVWLFSHQSGYPSGEDYSYGPSRREWILAVKNERKLK